MTEEPRLSPKDAQAKAQYEQAQQQLLAELHERMADRPAHREYLDAVMECPLDDVHREPLPRGVSQRVADAIQDDVLWIRDTYIPGYNLYSAPTRAYAKRRDIDARAVDRRAFTSTWSVLRLPGPSDDEGTK